MMVAARVEGQYGIVREVTSILDFNAPYCTILRQDAVDLAYPHAANRHVEEQRHRPDRVITFTTQQGIQRGIVVKLTKVSVGHAVARDVEAVVLELSRPRFLDYDFVLGLTFLRNFRLTVDAKKGYLSLL
jgi:predicted aspartyl protease